MTSAVENCDHMRDRRNTVYDLTDAAGFPRVGIVGRLDVDTTGLLLFTDDSPLNIAVTNRQKAQSMNGSKTVAVAKVYELTLEGNLDLAQLGALEKPLTMQVKGAPVTTLPATIDPDSVVSYKLPVDAALPHYRHMPQAFWRTRVHLTIHEGRNRQVRRLCLTAGLKLKYLHRIRVGTLRLGSLPQGALRSLTQAEVDALYHVALPRYPPGKLRPVKPKASAMT